MEVYLTCLETKRLAAALDVRFDVDSVIGYAKSLGFAYRGMRINLNPVFINNLTTSPRLKIGYINKVGRIE